MRDSFWWQRQLARLPSICIVHWLGPCKLPCVSYSAAMLPNGVSVGVQVQCMGRGVVHIMHEAVQFGQADSTSEPAPRPRSNELSGMLDGRPPGGRQQPAAHAAPSASHIEPLRCGWLLPCALSQRHFTMATIGCMRRRSCCGLPEFHRFSQLHWICISQHTPIRKWRVSVKLLCHAFSLGANPAVLGCVRVVLGSVSLDPFRRNRRSVSTMRRVAFLHFTTARNTDAPAACMSTS